MMSMIGVSTQEEYEEHKNGSNIIQINGSGKFIVDGTAPVHVFGISKVICETATTSLCAYDNSCLILRGNAHAHAFDHSCVEARDNTHIIASHNSKVDLYDNASAVLNDNVEASAYGENCVHCYGKSGLIAFGSCKQITAHNSSYVKAGNCSRVVARDTTRVDAADHARVCVKDKAHVMARHNSFVQVFNCASVDAYDHAEVIAHDTAFVRIFNLSVSATAAFPFFGVLHRHEFVAPTDFTAYKKLQGGVTAVLRISKGTRLQSVSGDKWRAESAEVVDIYKDGAHYNVGYSMYDQSYLYRVGEKVVPTKPYDEKLDECSSGIHFYLWEKRLDNEEWQRASFLCQIES